MLTGVGQTLAEAVLLKNARFSMATPMLPRKARELPQPATGVLRNNPRSNGGRKGGRD
jgi:hypothetical protein